MVNLFARRMRDGDNDPIIGYTNMASMIGWAGGAKYGFPAGQVCSLIDYACYIAGLPCLTVHYVRKANGDINEASFGGEWVKLKPEIVRVASSHEWTDDDLTLIANAISGLPNVCAKTLWADLDSNGEAYWRSLLHSRLNVKEAA